MLKSIPMCLRALESTGGREGSPDVFPSDNLACLGMLMTTRQRKDTWIYVKWYEKKRKRKHELYEKYCTISTG